MMNDNNLRIGKQDDLSIFADTMVEMTWPQVQKAAENRDIVILPVGIVEEHGPHMDLSPDLYLAYLYSKLLKQKLDEKGIPSIIAPPFYWGVAVDTKKYPGTFSVRPETMKALLTDIYTSLDSWGFTRLFIVNAHGDQTHIKMIGSSISETKDSLKLKVYNLGELDIAVENPPVYPAPRDGRFEPDYHAGAIETACMYKFFPQKVNAEMAKRLKPQSWFDPEGYYGDPASFDLENSIVEFYTADLEMDSLKIVAVLEKNL